MKPEWHRSWRFAAVAIDTAAVAVALGGAAILRFGPLGALDLAVPGLDPAFLSVPWVWATPIWIATFAAFGLYNPTRWSNTVEESRRLVAAGMAAPIAFIVVAFAVKQDPSRIWLGVGTAFAIASFALGRRGLRWLGEDLRRNGRWMTRTVVCGRNEAKPVVEELTLQRDAGFEPVATCGFDIGALPSFDLHDLTRAVATTRAGAVVVVADDLERSEVRQAVAVVDEMPATVFVLPGLDYMLTNSLQVVPVGREPGLALEAPSLRTYQRFLKRAIDLAAAAVAIVVLAPFAAVAALAIRLESRGPVLFRQRRIGHRGQVLEMLKFRTMIEGAHEMQEDLRDANESDGILFKIRDDPRLTRVGKFLRRFSIDELPQLWNVLRGDMSLVGPRPIAVADYERWGEQIALRRRLAVRPGITGLWQVRRREPQQTEDLVRLDLSYVQSWSFLLDLYILLKTIPVVARGRANR